MITGVGIGLRSRHFDTLIKSQPNVPWLEILSDNYLNSQGILIEKLQTIAKHYPMVMHGVNLSIAGTDEINYNYLDELLRLQTITQAQWISDHLCWTYCKNFYSHELLPLPFNQQTLQHCVERIQRVQDYLQQQIVLENVSSYIQFQADTLFEAEFLATMVDKADCFMLLDVNNIYVNSQNHNFDAITYLSYLDPKRIKQIHLAGYTEQQKILVDTHGEKIHQPVWGLYTTALKKIGAIATNIEWDNNIPTWDKLEAERQHADDIYQLYSSPEVAYVIG